MSTDSTQNKNPLEVISQKPWYKNGLRFSCTECGKCCTGRPGYTWVSLDEIEEIARFLKIEINEFVKKYLRKVDGEWALLEHLPNYDCIFLKEKRCSIYSVRPKQCRTFPWWKELLTSEAEWQRAQSYCEGINKEDGKLYSVQEIEENL